MSLVMGYAHIIIQGCPKVVRCSLIFKVTQVLVLELKRVFDIRNLQVKKLKNIRIGKNKTKIPS